MESGLKSFAKENCLLDQAFVIDPSRSVAQALQQAESQAGAPIALTGFVRFRLGEGVEKEEDDFAAEVARTAAGG
jgi:elongation factor Ts